MIFQISLRYPKSCGTNDPILLECERMPLKRIHLQGFSVIYDFQVNLALNLHIAYPNHLFSGAEQQKKLGITRLEVII